jgi:hypothetical protein
MSGDRDDSSLRSNGSPRWQGKLNTKVANAGARINPHGRAILGFAVVHIEQDAMERAATSRAGQAKRGLEMPRGVPTGERSWTRESISASGLASGPVRSSSTSPSTIESFVRRGKHGPDGNADTVCCARVPDLKGQRFRCLLPPWTSIDGGPQGGCYEREYAYASAWTASSLGSGRQSRCCATRP